MASNRLNHVVNNWKYNRLTENSIDNGVMPLVNRLRWLIKRKCKQNEQNQTIWAAHSGITRDSFRY